MSLSRSRTAVAGLAGLAGLVLAGCGSSSSPTASSSPSSAAAGSSSAAATSDTLGAACGSKVVIQTDWYATPERAASYQLVGPNGTIDSSKGTYSGTVDGTTVEVRLGGPFINNQAVEAKMYQDTSITLGITGTDDAIQSQKKFPTIGVVSPLDINPQILMWDPAHYTIDSWADVAKTNAKVLYFDGLPFMDYLVSKGYVKSSQLDASFDGTPSRFVADGGKDIQQGYASNEPYRWEHDVTGWKKPVKYLLVNDAGYQIYPQQMAVRSGDLTKLSPCLKKLVPLIQKAEVEYITSPDATNATLVKIATAIPDGPPITAPANADAVTVMKNLKIAGNGSNDTLGDFDTTRIQGTIDILKPIFATEKVDLPADLTPDTVVTNQFIDTSIHL